MILSQQSNLNLSKRTLDISTEQNPKELNQMFEFSLNGIAALSCETSHLHLRELALETIYLGHFGERIFDHSIFVLRASPTPSHSQPTQRHITQAKPKAERQQQQPTDPKESPPGSRQSKKHPSSTNLSSFPEQNTDVNSIVSESSRSVHAPSPFEFGMP